MNDNPHGVMRKLSNKDSLGSVSGGAVDLAQNPSLTPRLLTSHQLLHYAILALIGSTIALWDFKNSGELWLDDGARYCNNGAMVRDFLLFGDLHKPIEFAKKNYAQFPAHSIPYHPPAYPLITGIWFTVVGMSYFSIRLLIAAMFSGSLFFFHKILRLLGCNLTTALVGTLLLAFTPELITWSRTAMSEIPGLLFALGGLFFFLKFTATFNTKDIVFCFVLFELGFLTRIQTAGLLPGLFLYFAYRHGIKRTFDNRLILFALCYCSCNMAWIRFASNYSKIEMKSKLLSLDRITELSNWTQWITNLPNLAGWSLLLWIPFLILPYFPSLPKKYRTGNSTAFLLLLFLSVFLFEGIRGSHLESRYFVYGVPAIVGLSTLAMSRVWQIKSLLVKTIVACYFSTSLALGAFAVQQSERGLVGYENVGISLAKSSKEGNILVSTPWDSDLIFHYRCHQTKPRTSIIRGDRVLSIRFGGYAMEPTTQICQDSDDVHRCISDGAIRYIVTATPSPGTQYTLPAEMRLCHESVMYSPTKYKLVETNNISNNGRKFIIYIWENLDPNLSLQSILPINVPTAGLQL
ncbi:glycosyltransferase family 39 protein [bacterium]|nr:glycosyltransferase family 39 protein [bacterium]